MLVFALVSLGVIAGAYAAKQMAGADSESVSSSASSGIDLYVSDVFSLRTLKKLVFVYEIASGGEKSDWRLLEGDYGVSIILSHKPGMGVAVLPSVQPRDFSGVVGVTYAKSDPGNVITIGAVHEWRLMVADAVRRVEDADVD